MFLLVVVALIFSVKADVGYFYGMEANGMQAGMDLTASCSYSSDCYDSDSYKGACVSISASCCSTGTVTSNKCPV